MAEANKIDSNVTGLRIAEESSLGVLPGSPVWYDMEPNSYSDFGGNPTLVARNPISSRRKRKKGVITDLDANGGFNQDLTFNNLSFLWPGLFLSGKRQKFTVVSDGTGVDSPINDVDGTTNEYDLDGDQTANIREGDIIMATGFSNAANNGLKVVSGPPVFAAGVTNVPVSDTGLVDEATAADGATIKVVGYQFAGGEAVIARTAGSLPTLTAASKTMSELGLIPGEMVFLGGDTSGASGNQYTNASNNGFARIQAISGNTITFDKSSGGADGETEMAAETPGGTVTIQMFFGDVIRDEDSDDALYDRKTYTVERKLGAANPTSAPTEIQSEAIRGALLNEMALNVGQADKINVDLTFIGKDVDQRDGSSGNEPYSDSGSVTTVEAATAYNTSSDFTRIKLAEVRPTQGGVANLAAPVPLFAYVTEMTLNINNNGTPNKAVATLGAFDMSVGTCEVGGNITAYFGDIASVQAVRNNADVTLDFAVVKDFGTGTEKRKVGLAVDVPLIALGDGRLNVTQDEAITLPLQTDAAEYEAFGHQVILHEFHYLPDAADS